MIPMVQKLIFENSAWKLYAQGGRRVQLVSKTGLGTAGAYLVGEEYSYSAMDIYNRGARIQYVHKEKIPAYMLDKISKFFSRGRAYR
jgi:hypothetical protein